MDGGVERDLDVRLRLCGCRVDDNDVDLLKVL